MTRIPGTSVIHIPSLFVWPFTSLTSTKWICPSCHLLRQLVRMLYCIEPVSESFSSAQHSTWPSARDFFRPSSGENPKMVSSWKVWNLKIVYRWQLIQTYLDLLNPLCTTLLCASQSVEHSLVLGSQMEGVLWNEIGPVLFGFSQDWFRVVLAECVRACGSGGSEDGFVLCCG